MTRHRGRPRRSAISLLPRLAIAAVAVLATSLTPAAASPSRADPPLISTPPAPTGRILPEYVALGDSYSAGVLVRPWDDSDGCGRSYRNYPSQVAQALGLQLRDVTCSGAQVVQGALEVQPGSSLPGPASSPPAGSWPDRPAQIDALTPATGYVTVGIGGNSIGFAKIITTCLELGLLPLASTPCTNHYTRGSGAAWLQDSFDRLHTDFDTLLQKIRASSPRARIAVVGYPAIVHDDSGCTWQNWRQFGSVRTADLPWLDTVERRLNELLQQRAAAHGLTYVDTYRPSLSHGVCAAGSDRWMYGVKDDLTGEGDQTAPPGDFCRLLPGNGGACTFLHPNAAGLDNQARHVLRAFTG
ncbi:SGNH/GDSL hydrolase family protein [Streptomyces sp. NPDC006879]|uniref:SGNH/GDSL hydrolase family protein n=1 Tax=Streptomyces sp. NPDC006879 TaxID=3364767 RepID=UPI0036C9DC76